MARSYVLEAGAGSLAEFYEWLRLAQNGDTLVYWTGDLQYDRQVEIDPVDAESHTKMIEVSALNAVADAVMRHHKEKTLVVTQKRLGPCQYEYRATRLRAGNEKLQLRKFTRPNADLALV